MGVAGHQPLIGVLRAAGRERGEPGVDAADGRRVAPVPVLRQSADGAPPAARGHGGGAPSSSAPDAPDGSARTRRSSSAISAAWAPMKPCASSSTIQRNRPCECSRMGRSWARRSRYSSIVMLVTRMAGGVSPIAFRLPISASASRDRSSFRLVSGCPTLISAEIEARCTSGGYFWKLMGPQTGQKR